MAEKVQLANPWVSAGRQVADAMTKDGADALDALRAALRKGEFCVGQEEVALKGRAEERTRRMEQGKLNREANESKQKLAKAERLKKDANGLTTADNQA